MDPRKAALRVSGISTVVDSDKGGAVMGTKIDFNHRLQNRGSDFRVYANDGYSPDIRDTMLLAIVMQRLDLLAYEYIKVTPFSLQIVHNSTLRSEDITEHVVDALETANVHIIDND
jgi:hypothetical protein